MKKSLLLFALVLLLAGCASTGNQTAPAGGTPAVSPSEEPGLTAGAPEKMTCRIVDGAEEGELVLAGPGGAGDVYTLDTEGLAVDGTLADGAMVEVGFDGMILETYPAKFGHVTGVTVLEEPADDRCGLYLQVLSDLWEVDTALNTGLEELGVDLSGLTDLAEREKSALAWAPPRRALRRRSGPPAWGRICLPTAPPGRMPTAPGPMRWGRRPSRRGGLYGRPRATTRVAPTGDRASALFR